MVQFVAKKNWLRPFKKEQTVIWVLIVKLNDIWKRNKFYKNVQKTIFFLPKYEQLFIETFIENCNHQHQIVKIFQSDVGDLKKDERV